MLGRVLQSVHERLLDRVAADCSQLIRRRPSDEQLGVREPVQNGADRASRRQPARHAHGRLTHGGVRVREQRLDSVELGWRFEQQLERSAADERRGVSGGSEHRRPHLGITRLPGQRAQGGRACKRLGIR